MNESQSAVPLLDSVRPKQIPRNKFKYFVCKCCTTTALIIGVLSISGILASGYSIVFWHFHHEKSISVPGFPPLSITWMITILIGCTVLTFGLPIVVWWVCFKDDNEQIESLSPPLKIPDSKPETKQKINDSPPLYQKRIIGYYTDFNQNDIRKIQLEKLTHVIIDCVDLSKNGKINFKNETMKQNFSKLKSETIKSELKVMISIGDSPFFSTVMASASKRRKLSSCIVSFTKKHQIDGVNIFWEHPHETAKFKYSKFLKHLRKQFDKLGKKDDKQYIISIVAPKVECVKAEYGLDFNEIINYVDFINVLSLNYFAPFPSEFGIPEGPSAPLFSAEGTVTNYNVNYTIQNYIDETKRPDKLTIAIPFHVNLWKNVNEKRNSKNEIVSNDDNKKDSSIGYPNRMKWTRNQEIMKLAPASWDDETKTAYIYDQSAKTFLSFENVRSLASKMDYVHQMNLGGVWIWSVHEDDDNGTLLNSLMCWSSRGQKWRDSFLNSRV